MYIGEIIESLPLRNKRGTLHFAVYIYMYFSNNMNDCSIFVRFDKHFDNLVFFY